VIKMPARISRGKMVGHGRGHTLESYVVRVPPTGSSGMIDGSKIVGTISSVHNIYPLTADTYTLGSTTKEWLALYIGDSGGIYFGLGQDIFLSRVAANKLGLAVGDTFQADALETDTINEKTAAAGVTFPDEILVSGGVTGASPTPQIQFTTDYYDASGIPSASHILLYTGYGFGISSNDLDIITDANIKMSADGHPDVFQFLCQSQTIVIGNDCNLFRSAANVLKTSDDFHIAAGKGLYTDTIGEITGDAGVTIDSLTIKDGMINENLIVVGDIYGDGADTRSLGTTAREFLNLYIGDAGKIYLGTGQDVNLYRGGADILKTDDKLELNAQQIYMSNMAGGASTILSCRITATATDIFEIEADGTLRWGDGTNPYDISIGRSAANTMTLTASSGVILTAGLTVGSDIVSDTAETDSLGSATKEWLNLYIGNAGKIYLGTSQTVSIQRTAINDT